MRKFLLIFIATSSLLTLVFLFHPSATGRTIFALLTAIGALVLVGYHFVSSRNENPPLQFVDQSQAPNKTQLPVDTLFDATITSMREGMLVVDRDMRVVASNPIAYRLFGSAPRSVTNQRLTELTRNPAVYQAFLDGLQGIERSSVKVDMVGVERSVFELRVTPLALGNGNGPSGALGVFIDVTRTERLELVRQEFLSNVSHELRTPLTSVLAFVETLENGALEDPESSRRFLAIIRKNASRMHELIDELLELTAIEGGNVRLRAANVELRPIVDESISSLAAKAEAREISSTAMQCSR